MSTTAKILGPFSQIVTLSQLPERGPLTDAQLEILTDAYVVVQNSRIEKIGQNEALLKDYPKAQPVLIERKAVLLPGFIDAHTHLCFSGKRSLDFSLRLAGQSYVDIQAAGGGILDTVSKTRKATSSELLQTFEARANRLLASGITTAEIKSGYGLNVEDELKMLSCIRSAQKNLPLELIPTCLAAHALPPEFNQHAEYLNHCLYEILPKVKAQNLSQRVDIFVEENGFNKSIAKPYLQKCKSMGFDLTIHADQFSLGGSSLACELSALSADHLEVSTKAEISALSLSHVVAMVLPLATLGLGLPFAPARQMLNAGCILGIASDWNPGSAPHGDLLTGASFLATAEKLTNAEVFSAITFRAAKALNLPLHGRIRAGYTADFAAFPTSDFRDILYHQGQMKPFCVIKKGQIVYSA